jgi:hypothetical protein
VYCGSFIRDFSLKNSANFFMNEEDEISSTVIPFFEALIGRLAIFYIF